MELARPGATRKLLGDENIELGDADEAIAEQLDKLRFFSVA